MTINIKRSPSYDGGRLVQSKGIGGGMRTKMSQPTGTSIVTSGLVMHLDAGDPLSYPGSGTAWTDLSGYNNNATLYGGWSYDPANGGRIIFDGVNGSAALLSVRTGFPFGSSPGSISGWGKTDTLSGVHWIFAYGNPSNGLARFVGIVNNTYYFGGYNDDITAPGVAVDTWFNICGTYDGTNARLYINGSLVTGPTAKSWNTFDSYANVGAQAGGGDYWDGSVAQALVYSTALTDGEVLQNFNALKGRFGL
jgi:hypothetical protein